MMGMTWPSCYAATVHVCRLSYGSWLPFNGNVITLYSHWLRWQMTNCFARLADVVSTEVLVASSLITTVPQASITLNQPTAVMFC